MLCASVVRFIGTSKLAVAVVAGFVGLAAGGGLAVAAVHLASNTAHQATSAATPGNGQAQGHGAEVTAAVAKCRAELKLGQHGIGKCVSADANKHGKAASAAGSANRQKSTADDSSEQKPSSNP